MTAADGSTPRRSRRNVLLDDAGQRTRTLDASRFVVENRGSTPVTFRLQLFTGPRLRPVALLTQSNGEGASVINRIESCAEAIWQQCCAQEPQPPIVVAHLIMDAGGSEESSLGLRHIGFTVAGRHTVASPPIWGGIMPIEALQDLLGGPVDISRGPFTRPGLPPEPVRRYGAGWVLFFPTPELDDDDPPCLRHQLTWTQRLARQVRGRHQDQGCCWYHGGDWHRVCRAALLAVRSARRAGIDEEDMFLHADQASDNADLSDWEREAFKSLFLEPLDISRDSGIGYVNGRHRSHALLAAGVHLAPVTRWRT